MFSIKEIQDLKETIKRIPSISNKQSEKIVNFILSADKTWLETINKEIKNARHKIKSCFYCTKLTDSRYCEICTDPDRDNILMIIESRENIERFEKSKIFNGKYFVVSDLFNFRYEINKSYSFDFLKKYALEFEEIILAFSPNDLGIINMNEIKNQLKMIHNNINMLSIGIPLGSSIDGINSETIDFAIKNRKRG